MLGAMWTLAKPKMPGPGEALPGRAEKMPVPEKHFVSGARLQPPFPAGMQLATFGLGCFWGAEKKFWQQAGVYSTAVGYAGGTTPNPTYREVCSGLTGHTEVVQVVFDPKVVSYNTLLDLYWHRTDPRQADGQFCDHGASYHPAIFWRNESQRAAAEASKAQVEKQLGKPVVTYIRKAGPFWRAEEYHQDFYKKNPVRYQLYRSGCGRDARLKQLWGERAGH